MHSHLSRKPGEEKSGMMGQQFYEVQYSLNKKYILSKKIVAQQFKQIYELETK